MRDCWRDMIIVIIALVLSIFAPQFSYADPLTAGATYTITVDAINSSGSIVSLGLSTTAVADSNQKLTFSFTGVPTRDSYNFLLVTTKDSDGTVVRRAIVPAPAAGDTVNLGVSPMTKAQTEAMLSAMQAAGTDDPIMVLFGFVIIRSGGFSSEDISHLANAARLAIINGFNVYLEDKIGATKMALFRNAIVSRLSDYTANLKESVDAATSTASKDQRAEAAALLPQILIEAAAEADFDVGYITAAMKAASDQFETYLLTPANEGGGADMDEAAVAAVDRVMMANYLKLSAERVRKKYTAALTTLNATQDQITRLNDAITTLTNSLLDAFQKMEELFEDEEGTWTADEADSKFENVNTDINNAFNTFMADIASTNSEIDEMVQSMSTGFDIPLANLNNIKDPNSDGDYTDGIFTFWNMAGTQHNWPITMTVPVIWVANNYGNNFAYTRDTLALPKGMTWIPHILEGNYVRTDWGDFDVQGVIDDDADEGNGIPNDELCIPAGLAALFGLREDVEIIMARKWAGLAAASKDMTQAGYNMLENFPDDRTLATNHINQGKLTLLDSEDTPTNDDTEGALLDSFEILNELNPWLTGYETEGLEDLALSRIAERKADITVTSGTITDAQKQALIDVAVMPDFH
ncbi:MAG: hypothetical protein NC828_01220 [Candidatus Omnitrophica bacterium]|nr:hypothetical protein [Candidatus Omnitrophota bacterium]